MADEPVAEVNGSFLLLAGKISPEQYKAACQKAGPKPQQTVFVFPGHKNHHHPSTLFGEKWKEAGGLGATAYQLSEQGIPALSLPTSGMESVASAEAIPEAAKQAVADLWKAIGYGMNIALPVRKPNTENGAKVYFEAGKRLKKGKVYKVTESGVDNAVDTNDNDYEPSFWGNIEATPNVHLANYYLQQLELIRGYMEKKNEVPENFINAFNEGKAAQSKTGNDLPEWFREQAAKMPVIVSTKKSTYAVADLTKKQQESITNLYRDHDFLEIKSINPSEIIIQEKTTNEKAFTINSISVTAAKSTNSKNIYIEMFQSSIVLFGENAPLFAFAPNEDEKTKMEAAIKELKSIYKDIEKNAKIITNPKEFAKYENPTASSSSAVPPPPPPPPPVDKFEKNWLIHVLNNGSIESVNPDKNKINYSKISFDPKSNLEEGITLIIEVANQDAFTGSTVEKSAAQDERRKQVYDTYVAELQTLGIEATMVSTDDHKNIKISKADILKLKNINDSPSVKNVRNLLDVLYRLQNRDQNDVALKAIINNNVGQFFQIKITAENVEISVKHKDPNIAQALRNALSTHLKLKITGDNKVMDNDPAAAKKQYSVTIPKAEFDALKTQLNNPTSSPSP